MVVAFLCLNCYQYQNQRVDRFKPLIEMEVGYTILPKEVTYNDGAKYDKKKSEKGEAPFPGDYQNMHVIDGLFGESAILTFSGGQSPEGKNYAVVQHKGLYVRRISFITWESIPGVIRANMSKEYNEMPMTLWNEKHFD